jgi:hypothetical protein
MRTGPVALCRIEERPNCVLRLLNLGYVSLLRMAMDGFGGRLLSLPNTDRMESDIEKKLHWILDIAFHEDECLGGIGSAAKNFGRLRQIVLTLQKQEMGTNLGIKHKRL